MDPTQEHCISTSGLHDQNNVMMRTQRATGYNRSSQNEISICIRYIPSYHAPFAFATIRSISTLISAKFAFKVFASSNFLCAFASSIKDSSKASCSRSGCSASASSESGSMVRDSLGVSFVDEGTECFLGFGRD